MKSVILILVSMICFSPLLMAQSSGQLDVSISTSHAGGNYSPKNVIAVWVENDQGDFIKTLLARANKRKTHLNTWQASTDAAGTEYNTVDAITGATLSNHGTRTCAWNGEDYNGTLVDDGNYKLWMELTDKNSTGNYSSFDFVKSEETQSLNPEDVASFTNIQISWTPDPISISESLPGDNEYQIKVNPVSDVLQLNKIPEGPFLIFNYYGKCVFEGSKQSIDFQGQMPGIYFIVFSNNQKVLKFIKI